MLRLGSHVQVQSLLVDLSCSLRASVAEGLAALSRPPRRARVPHSSDSDREDTGTPSLAIARAGHGTSVSACVAGHVRCLVAQFSSRASEIFRGVNMGQPVSSEAWRFSRLRDPRHDGTAIGLPPQTDPPGTTPGRFSAVLCQSQTGDRRPDRRPTRSEVGRCHAAFVVVFPDSRGEMDQVQ